jgi:ATP adenylyltransferase
MQYIGGPKPAAGCVLCAYVGKSPSAENGVLAALPMAYVVLNKYPYSAAHLMVVPNAHTRSLTELPLQIFDATFRLVRDSVAALGAATGAEGFNVGLNLGRASGAGLEEHLHVHLVPRWSGDHNFMPVIGGTKVLPEYLEDTWRRLEPHFQSVWEPA